MGSFKKLLPISNFPRETGPDSFVPKTVPQCNSTQHGLNRSRHATSKQPISFIERLERLTSPLRQTANRNLYHVTKFPLCLSPILFIISTHKLVVSRKLLSIIIFWAVVICSFSILRNSQLESDICRIREA